MLILKIIFLNKKYYFNIFLNKKYFKPKLRTITMLESSIFDQLCKACMHYHAQMHKITLYYSIATKAVK